MRRLCDRCQLPISWLRRRGPALQVAQSAHRQVNLKRRVTCDRDSRIRLPRSFTEPPAPSGQQTYRKPPGWCSKRTRKPFGSVASSVGAHAHATIWRRRPRRKPAAACGARLGWARLYPVTTMVNPDACIPHWQGRMHGLLLRSMQLARSPATAKSHVRTSGRAII